jgi:hypothetical protein
LILFGVSGANVGWLLWPAAALHLILAVLMTRAWIASPTRTCRIETI